MIKTFIFDCGGVLFGYSSKHLCDVFVGDNQDDRNLVKEAVFPRWHLQDEGLKSSEYFDLIKKDLPERLHESAYNIIFHWKDVVWPLEGMYEFVKELKDKGYRLILLSNMPDTFSYNHDDIEALKYFDELVFSFIVKMAKPNRNIFDYTIKQYNLNPEECLFIDDNSSNIETGKQVGLNTYLFDSKHPEEFISYCRKLIA